MPDEPTPVIFVSKSYSPFHAEPAIGTSTGFYR
jgi:hypothetical protein